MSREQKIHLAFVVSLIFKGLFDLSEILGGLSALAVALISSVYGNSAFQQFLLRLATLATQEELSEDPKDFIANYVLHAAQTTTASSLNFAGLYLLLHGIIKLWLIVGLLRERLWYYPTALVIFAFFIVYQLYRYSFTHSIFLLLITFVDAVVIALTWHEYKYLKSITTATSKNN